MFFENKAVVSRILGQIDVDVILWVISRIQYGKLSTFERVLELVWVTDRYEMRDVRFASVALLFEFDVMIVLFLDRDFAPPGTCGRRIFVGGDEERATSCCSRASR